MRRVHCVYLTHAIPNNKLDETRFSSFFRFAFKNKVYLLTIGFRIFGSGRNILLYSLCIRSLVIYDILKIVFFHC